MGDKSSKLEKWWLYGLTVESDFPFAVPLARGHGTPDVRFRSGVSMMPGERRRFRHVYSSAFRDANGRALFELFQDGARELLSFTNRAEFLFDDGTISYQAVGDGEGRDVETLFLTSVLAYWLERRGVLVLHAAAVQVGGRTVAFLAPAGGGKSSLAAAFHDAGHLVVSDDILPLEVHSSRVEAHTGFRQIKLNPDTGEHFLGDDFGSLRLFDPLAKKRCLDIPVSAGAARCGPLAVTYVIERRGQVDGLPPVQIEEIQRRDAVIEILRSTYTPTLVEGVGLAERRLEQMSRLVQLIPVVRLTYESDLDLLPQVVEAVGRDLLARTPQSG